MGLSIAGTVPETFTQASWPVLLLYLALLLLGLYQSLILFLHCIAPKPRPAYPSEKAYITSTATSATPTQGKLACWFDRWLAERHISESKINLIDADTDDTDPRLKGAFPNSGTIEPAEVRVTVVFPAYNEEQRILPTLQEALEYLDENFGRTTEARQDAGAVAAPDDKKTNNAPSSRSSSSRPTTPRRHMQNSSTDSLTGYEILIVDDGSRDNTIQVCLDFAKKHNLHDILRVIKLEKNRGKGGAVTHGMRHARGEYILFADADGASRFSDLERLIQGCEEVVDGSHRGVAIGSRAHLVGSEAVVKRSVVRNFLMRSFHMVLMILTPPATSRLRDTQCGFKLFTRAALPHIVPYMHVEGWIFDIEMLLLAESAPPAPVLGADGGVIGTSPGIHVVEVPIDWHEVEGSKMSLVSDSIRMAWGLFVLRASWMMGVYRRRLT